MHSKVRMRHDARGRAHCHQSGSLTTNLRHRSWQASSPEPHSYVCKMSGLDWVSQACKTLCTPQPCEEGLFPSTDGAGGLGENGLRERK